MLSASPSPRTRLGAALRLGNDDGTFTVRVGAHGLRRLGALAAILCRLLLAFRHHASKNRLAVFLRQIGAADPDIDDLDAKRLSLLADLVADLPHDRRAFMGEQRGQGHVARAPAAGCR